MNNRRDAYERAKLELLATDIDVIRTSDDGGGSVLPGPGLEQDTDENKGEWD